MNIRKNIDYSDLYTGIDKAVAANFSQMELYLELGRLVSSRPEKGAAVMAAEYICAHYPDRTGFSPRNLRRMRNFYRMYEGCPEILAQAMKIGWTQNIVIMEGDLEMNSRLWYLTAVQRFGWSKSELAERIAAGARLLNSSEEEPRNSNDNKSPVKSTRQRMICHSWILTVDFLKRFWYNGSWVIHSFRQTATKGEVYG